MNCIMVAVFVLVSAMIWNETNTSFVDSIVDFVEESGEKAVDLVQRSTEKLKCTFGENEGACLRSFYLENKTLILVFSVIGALLLVAICWRCFLCRRKSNALPQPTPGGSLRKPFAAKILNRFKL